MTTTKKTSHRKPRGVLLDSEALRRALDARYPGRPSRKSQVGEVVRTGLISERWMYRALEKRSDLRVDLEQARNLAAVLQCSLAALVTEDDDGLAPEAAPESINPFRSDRRDAQGLDEAPIYGRDTAIQTLVRWVAQGLGGTEARIIDLVGTTGSGKSKLLNGLLRATRDGDLGAYPLLLQPDEFPDPTDANCAQVLRRKLTTRWPGASTSGQHAPPLELSETPDSVEAIARDLAELAVRERPLVIGIDDATAFLTDSIWAPIHLFVTTLLDECEHVCVVAASRFAKKATEQGDQEQQSWQHRPARRYELAPLTPEFLHALIEQPFAEEAEPLTDKQVTTLIDNTLSLQKSPLDAPQPNSGHAGSPLPLLSLTLDRLLEKKRAASHRSNILQDDDQELDEDGIPAHVIRNSDLDLARTVDARAQRAWSRWEANRKNSGRTLTDDDLTSFFCALVYLSETVVTRNEVTDSDSCLSLLQLGTLKVPQFAAFREFIDDLVEDGLMRASPDGVRLAHRSILRHWSKARDWFSNRRGGTPEDAAQPAGWQLLETIARVRYLDEHDEASAATVLAVFAPWAHDSAAPFWLKEPIRKARATLSNSCSVYAEIAGVAAGTRVIHILAFHGMAGVIRDRLRELSSRTQPTLASVIGAKRKTDDRTPIHFAAWSRSVETIRVLLDHGADACSLDKQLWTPLAVCAAASPEGDDDAFLALLRQTLATSDAEAHLRQAAAMCVSNDNPTRLSVLLRESEQLLQPDGSGWTLLARAVRLNSERIVAELLDTHRDAVLAAERDTRHKAFHEAAARGAADLLTTLLEAARPFPELLESWRQPTGYGGLSPLQLATLGGHAAVIRLLAGFAPVMERHPESGLTALHIAAGSVPYSLSRLRPSDEPPSPDSVGEVFAALTEHEGCDWFAVEKPPPPETLTQDDSSTPGTSPTAAPASRLGRYHLTAPIAECANRPHRFKVLVQCLVAKGQPPLTRAQVEAACSPDGDTFVHLLAGHQDPDWAAATIQTILPERTSIDLIDHQGRTPLAIAIGLGHTAVTRGLLRFVREKERHAKIDQALRSGDRNLGRIPLHLVALRGDIAAARDLHVLDAGSQQQWEQPDHFGMSANSLAAPAVRELLDSRGWTQKRKLGEQRRRYLDQDGLTFSLTPRVPGRDTNWDREVEWLPLDGDRLPDELRRTIERHTPEGIARSSMHVAELPFYEYPAVAIVRLELDPTATGQPPPWPNARHAFRYALVHDGELFPLDGSSTPMHRVAGDGKFLIRQRPATDFEWDRASMFLRFFCESCRAKAGPFLVVEPTSSRSDLLELSHIEQRAIAATRRPILCHQGAKGQHFVAENTYLSATIWYSNALSFCDFEITPQGVVSMLWSTPLVTGLSAVPWRTILATDQRHTAPM